MNQSVEIEEDLCSGCQSCIMACSLGHEGYASPSSARLKVNLKLFDENQIDFCRQCPNPPCVEVCPEGAISRGSENDPWEIDYEKCTYCKSCVSACPFDAMQVDPLQDRVIKCDLCGEQAPACVEACPVEALSIAAEKCEAGLSTNERGDKE